MTIAQDLNVVQIVKTTIVVINPVGVEISLINGVDRRRIVVVVAVAIPIIIVNDYVVRVRIFISGVRDHIGSFIKRTVEEVRLFVVIQLIKVVEAVIAVHLMHLIVLLNKMVLVAQGTIIVVRLQGNSIVLIPLGVDVSSQVIVEVVEVGIVHEVRASVGSYRVITEVDY